MKRVIRIGIVVLLALAIIGNAALAAAIVLTREPAAKPLTPERVAAASKPAIVFIQSEYAITTSIPEPKITDETWQAIYDELIAQRYYSSAPQLEHDAEQVIMNNPGAYMSAGNAVTDTWSQWETGSGFFVTEDGYLVTAAHVVTANKSDVRDEIVAYTKDPAFVADDTNQIKKGWADFSPTDAQVANLVAFDQKWIQQYITVAKIDSKYYLATGASVQAGDNTTTNGIRASVVSVDPTVGGHDIAIMKASVTSVPALAIAATDPSVGDATYAMGYPRTAYLQEQVPSNQSVPVSVTVGKIQHMNSLTSTEGSWKVYGTDAQFTHGDSGGPVVDARGNVMGVISYIIPDANGNQLPGQGYFVPASFIREDLAKANVTIAADPTQANLTNTYYRALGKGDEGRYKDELNMLLSIQSRSSVDAYINDDINHVRSEIDAGNDRTPPVLTGYVLPAAGSGAGVIVIALLSWLLLAIFVRKPKVALTAPVAALAPPAEPPAEPASEVVAETVAIAEAPQPVPEATPAAVLPAD